MDMRRSSRAAAAGEEPSAMRSPESRLEEAVGLAGAIHLDIVGQEIVPVARRRPATLWGEGKVEELRERIEELEAELVVIDGHLTPVQQRNLERTWKVKILDRTALILEIFGERAQTREGRLQVELAHLTYQKSRLVRSWTHLERQRGGFGFLGGPGETQIESDRRQIQERIARLQRELDAVKRTRELHRKTRREVPYPVIALAGYTNAGKSTLFNRLTHSDVFAEDLLFATLDPTMRSLVLPSGRKVILSDTVGFISDLPTQLVAAFRATLEEVLEAEVIVHVRDISHEETEIQKADVEGVLKDLGARDDDARQRIEVLNKIDLLPADAQAAIHNAASRETNVVALSALTGEGTDRLLALIDRLITDETKLYMLDARAEEGGVLAAVHAEHAVRASEIHDDGSQALQLVLSDEAIGRIEKRYPGFARRLHAASPEAAR
ncbi:MAG: GTPase HflX [Parvibaculaceae bacterium]|nr:GTPase HflX [Parvibaculaceae bacterium]